MVTNPFLELATRLDNIEKILIDIKRDQARENKIAPDEWHDLDWLSDYTGLAKSTLYPKLPPNGEIPGHKQGKKWYFLKSQIDFYLKQGKVKTLDEIDAAADAAIMHK